MEGKAGKAMAEKEGTGVTAARITGRNTIREVLAKYPQTRAVFERHGLLECGGPLGPKEPIAFFARAHRVNEEQLLRELNEAVAAETAEAIPQGKTVERSSRSRDTVEDGGGAG